MISKNSDNELEDFYATTEHQSPSRILYYADFAEEIRKEVSIYIKSNDIDKHYGFLKPINIPVKRPDGTCPPDYSKYYKSKELPAGTFFTQFGIARVPGSFHHFSENVSPLTNASGISELENYPIEDLNGFDFLI